MTEIHWAVTSVQIDRAKLGFMLNNPQGDLGLYLRRRGLAFMAAARRQVGSKTGMLRRSIRMEHTTSPTGQTLTIGSPLPYALMHHNGTRPHVIVAHPGGELRFAVRGRMTYAKRVLHPGTRPNRFLSDNLAIFRL